MRLRTRPPIGEVWRGAPYPMGATWDGAGVNFALFSQHAEKVELCIYEATGRRELQRIEIRERTDGVWHCYLPEAEPGLVYGYRVHGPYRPEDGQRFNAHKLLVDPYAKELVGTLRWSDVVYGYTVNHRREDLSHDRRDSASCMPKCRVVDEAFTWGSDQPPLVPWHETIIYETHVRGLTMRHPEIPARLRGSYAAIASEPMLEYYRRLGVTTLELLPIHALVDERRLAERRMRNYWGYNTLGYFALEGRYSAGGGTAEFKTMVKRLHAAGIEVLLDVVYNHTCEGNHLGPTLSFRGIDNAAYYRLSEGSRRHYVDFTGCGNTLNLDHPRVLQMVIDSLRYWVEVMHVDGFRFDLASTLARENGEFDHSSGFLKAVRQDPVLNRVKLIAEPWDLGAGGYQVGNFPPGWAEWNDRYRNAMRSYWKGDGAMLGELARRFAGSSELFAHAGRRPQASVNFITAHDGFTLHDLVSYNSKHNEANGEANRDGNDHNLSWNCGAEGPTADPEINALRERQKRNFLATLLLSQGVPMLLAGDERGHTQQGNNNAYCQDNATSWIDWTETPERTALTQFARKLIGLRRSHRTFRRRDFFQGRALAHRNVKDVVWLKPDGGEVAEHEWNQEHARTLGLFLAGGELAEVSRHGARARDDDFLLLFNSHHEPVAFRIPLLDGASWRAVVDTSAGANGKPRERFGPRHAYPLGARALAVLTRPSPDG